jgi:hypothetical protein
LPARRSRQIVSFVERAASEKTRTGACGRARIAPLLAIAAATPQTDMPEASGADTFAAETEAFAGDEIKRLASRSDRPR